MKREHILDIKQCLKEKGYKLTLQRQLIFDIILKQEGMHLSSDEVYKLSTKLYPDIGLTTVYRILTLFQEIGLLKKVYLDGKSARYELNNDGEMLHHHLVCDKCGAVIEITDDVFQETEKTIWDRNGFKLHKQMIKLSGVCKNCALR